MAIGRRRRPAFFLLAFLFWASSARPCRSTPTGSGSRRSASSTSSRHVLTLRGWLVLGAGASRCACLPVRQSLGRRALGAPRRALGAGGPARPARPRQSSSRSSGALAAGHRADRVRVAGLRASGALGDRPRVTSTRRRSAGWIRSSAATSASTSSSCRSGACSTAGRSTLAAGTLVLTAAVYVLQRSLVLTARGPRLAAGARTHLLGLGASLLAAPGGGLLARPVRSALLAARARSSAPPTPTSTRRCRYSACSPCSPSLCAVACLVQIGRPGWLFLVGRARGAGRGVGGRARRLSRRCCSASG